MKDGGFEEDSKGNDSGWPKPWASRHSLILPQSARDLPHAYKDPGKSCWPLGLERQGDSWTTGGVHTYTHTPAYCLLLKLLTFMRVGGKAYKSSSKTSIHFLHCSKLVSITFCASWLWTDSIYFMSGSFWLISKSLTFILKCSKEL